VGDKVEVIACSSPDAIFVVVKTFSEEEITIPAGAERRHAVRELANEQCPARTVFWTDEYFQGVCWARR
jgi:hypothetical protein